MAKSKKDKKKKKKKKKKPHITHINIKRPSSSDHIDGKSYSDMLKEVIDTSPIDLKLKTHLNDCYVMKIDNPPGDAALIADDAQNVVKNSVTIHDVSADMINKVTVYFKAPKGVKHVTRTNNSAIKQYGEQTATVDKFNIWKESDAIAHADKVLHQSKKKHGMQIELSAIAHPLFNIMEWCKINLNKYHIHNLILPITRINFKFQAGKAPIMDICLNDYTHFNAAESNAINTHFNAAESNAINISSDDAKALGKALGNPKAIWQWIRDNITYQFYYGKSRSPNTVLHDRRANCYDQTDLAVEMMKAAGYDAYRVCGQRCKRYRHCNGRVNINGKIVIFDTVGGCQNLNQLN